MYLDNLLLKNGNASTKCIDMHDFYTIIISGTEEVMAQYSKTEEYLAKYKLSASESYSNLALEGFFDNIKNFFIKIINFIKQLIKAFIKLLGKIFATFFGNSIESNFEKAYRNRDSEERKRKADEDYRKYRESRDSYYKTHEEWNKKREEFRKNHEEAQRKAYEEAKRKAEEEYNKKRKAYEEAKRKAEEEYKNRSNDKYSLFDLKDFAMKMSNDMRDSSTIKKLRENTKDMEAFSSKVINIVKKNIDTVKDGEETAVRNIFENTKAKIDDIRENRNKEFFDIYIKNVKNCGLILSPDKTKVMKNIKEMKEIMLKTKKEYESELNGLEKICEDIKSVSNVVYSMKEKGEINDTKLDMARGLALLQKDSITTYIIFIKKGCVVAASGMQKITIFNMQHIDGASPTEINNFVDSIDRNSVDNL